MKNKIQIKHKFPVKGTTDALLNLRRQIRDDRRLLDEAKTSSFAKMVVDIKDLRSKNLPYEMPLGTRELKLSSFWMRIKPRLLERALDSIGISVAASRQKPIVVFAGYNGRLAMALKRAGYNVIFTDIDAEWVKRAKRKGFRARVEDVTSPKINPKDVLAYCSYQPPVLPIESISGNEGMAAYTHMLGAQQGIVLFDFFQPKNHSSRRVQTGLEYLQHFLVQSNIAVTVHKIPGSKTMEGKELCAIHIRRK